MKALAEAATKTINPAHIPQELQDLRQWVLWRYEARGKDGEATKIPYATAGYKASATSAKTWDTFAAVLNAYMYGNYDGVGLVLTESNNLVGFDLDDCISAEGVIEPWALEIVDKLNSYTYITPSGRGLRVMVRGTLPKAGRRVGSLEVYASKRYLTFTGDLLPGRPMLIETRQAEIDEIYSKYWPEVEPAAPNAPEAIHLDVTLDDWELIAKAHKAKNGAKFAQLWAGDFNGYQSQSEADQALCDILAFWTRDPDQIDRLFRASGLYRDKWEREDYRQATISKALDRVTVSYTPNKQANGSKQRHSYTDLGNARRLVELHGADLRYSHPAGKWYVWNFRRWVSDDTAEVMRMAKDTVRSLYAEAAKIEDEDDRKALIKWALSSESLNRLKSMVTLAESESNIPVLPDELDRNPWLLTVGNGTLNLKTGRLQPHDRGDLITKAVKTCYEPEAKAPLWEAFLHRIMDGNTDLIGFLQRAAGYCLTGDVGEQVMFILHGSGANGKSVFLNMLLSVLGPLGLSVDPDLLIAKHNEAHPTGLASLCGSRLAVAVETRDGCRLNEPLVKWLTGGDKLTARFMRQDFFEFTPTHKFFLATNHKPIIRGTDLGMWRRLRLIPFNVTIPPAEQDRNLTAKLQAELPGILAWAVRGCLEWQLTGLQAPNEVMVATNKYRQEMDIIAQFLEDCSTNDRQAETNATDLYRAYTTWCDENGERSITQNAFGRQLTEIGYEGLKRSGKKWWQGLKLEITDFQ